MDEFSIFQYAGGLAIAVFVGFLTGIFGVGGGFLMSPSLIIIGIHAPIAVGTDVATIMVNSAFGIFKRRRSGTVDVKLALTLSIASIIGVYLGTLIMESLKHLKPLVIMGKEHIAVQYIIFCLFFLILIGLTIFLFIDNRLNNKKNQKHIGLFSKVPFGPYLHFSSLDGARVSAIPLFAMGLAIGILTGLLGIGGGVLLLPALIYLVGQLASRAAGTSLLLVLISSSLAMFIHTKNGNLNFYLWGIMIVGGLVGTNFGTIAGLKLKDAKIRSYFPYVVLTAVIAVGIKLYKITFCP